VRIAMFEEIQVQPKGHKAKFFLNKQQRAKKHKPTSDRASNIRASCSIDITINTQLRRISIGNE